MALAFKKLRPLFRERGQINAEVPTGLAPTTGAPVIIKIGDWTSTPNVTVSIK